MPLSQYLKDKQDKRLEPETAGVTPKRPRSPDKKKLSGVYESATALFVAEKEKTW